MQRLYCSLVRGARELDRSWCIFAVRIGMVTLPKRRAVVVLVEGLLLEPALETLRPGNEKEHQL